LFCGQGRIADFNLAGLGFNIRLASGDGLESITGQQIQNGRFLIAAWRELLLAGSFLVSVTTWKRPQAAGEAAMRQWPDALCCALQHFRFCSLQNPGS
jgi:hypothetical protein